MPDIVRTSSQCAELNYLGPMTDDRPNEQDLLFLVPASGLGAPADHGNGENGRDPAIEGATVLRLHSIDCVKKLGVGRIKS